MDKFLVTGGAGFIGFHLASALAEAGARVDILDNLARGVVDGELRALLARPNVSLIERDLLRPGALDDLPRDYDGIFHLAAIIGVSHVLKRPYHVLHDNVAMLANLLAFCTHQKALKRFLFASTSEVYAGSLLHLQMPVPTPEDTVLALPDLAQPRTSYMLSKLYGEAMCLQSGLPVTIVRPHNLYGPRMGLSHVVPELLAKAHRLPEGSDLDVASVEHRRAFCYIDDAVAMVLALLRNDAACGGTFNLGNQDLEISIGELAELIVATVGKGQRIVSGPVTSGSPSRRCPEMSRMVGTTGLRPAVSLREGVARTYDWYRRKVFDGGEISAL